MQAEVERAVAPLTSRCATIRVRSTSSGVPVLDACAAHARSPKGAAEAHAIAQLTAPLSEHDIKLQERLREEIALRKAQNAALEV